MVKDEIIWATQKAIAILFDVDVLDISKYVKNIFTSRELDEKVVSAEIAHTTQHDDIEGKTQTVHVGIIILMTRKNGKVRLINRWVNYILLWFVIAV